MKAAKFIFPILIILLLIALQLGCKIIRRAELEDRIGELEKQVAEKEIGGETAEEVIEELEETGEDFEEAPGEAVRIDEDPATEREAPAIYLSIIEGPFHETVEDICYYRVEAVATGSPAPTIEFSRDDSLKAFGPNICQVNLYSPWESYTLVATATNSSGSATDNLTLSWGCEIGETGDEEEIIEDVHAYSFSTFANSSLSGFIVEEMEATTGTVQIGDNINNIQIKGYLSFDISSLPDTTVESATLTISNIELLRNPQEIGTVFRIKYFAYDTLDLSDFEPGGETLGDWEVSGLETIVISTDSSSIFLDTLNAAIGDTDVDYYQIKLGINGTSNGDGRSDKIVIDPNYAVLEIVYYR